MVPPATNETTTLKKSKFRVEKAMFCRTNRTCIATALSMCPPVRLYDVEQAAAPQGVKRGAEAITAKGAVTEIPKARKVRGMGERIHTKQAIP